MSSDNSSSGSRSFQRRSPPEDKHSRFTFVSESTQADARSHAMREHWRQRHSRNNGTTTRRVQPKLLPSPASGIERVSKSQDRHSTRVRWFRSHGSHRLETPTSRSASNDTDQDHDERSEPLGVPAQLLGGVSHALSTSRLDPFQTFPVHLTSQHHKLLHHWIGTHATMMFEGLDIPNFNPMKDVWFPLDLSNASSFNAIMAHSAAHLAHLYSGTSPEKGTNSADAFKFKAEAVRILHEWLCDPEKALSYDAFAAVIRLLTFERYWGTADEWNIHRSGLQRMIEAKGGVKKLHDNWRLEMVVYLVSLMTKPSWFESTNNISEISEPSTDAAFTSDPSLDFQKIRCLWLISFIQDLRTFMGFSSRFYTHGLSTYPFIYHAVCHLRDDFQIYHTNSSLDTGISKPEYDRLICLFSICVMMQDSITSPSPPTGSIGQVSPTNVLDRLDTALAGSQSRWSDSVRGLLPFLQHHLIKFHADGAQKTIYITRMAEVLGQLSLEARIGVEKCLLNMLCRSKETCATFLVDDGWTPDSLLSSMHGQ